MLPRLASLMDMGATSDVIEVLGADTFMRGIYAGAAVATIKTEDPYYFYILGVFNGSE